MADCHEESLRSQENITCSVLALLVQERVAEFSSCSYALFKNLSA